jgi:hypothetical protein
MSPVQVLTGVDVGVRGPPRPQSSEGLRRAHGFGLGNGTASVLDRVEMLDRIERPAIGEHD